MLALSIRRNPIEDLTIAFSGGELLEQGVRIKSKEIQKPLVHRTRVVILSVLFAQRRASFVQHAGQSGVAAQTHASAAGRMLGEVRGVVVHKIEFPFGKPVVGWPEKSREA